MTHEPRKITELMAWIATEPDGGEGIPAVPSPGARGSTVVLMPLVGGDAERIASLEPYAQVVATMKGLPVKLVRFSFAEIVRELQP